MTLIVLLGKYITIPILSEWLSPSCLSLFDSALCNRQHRRIVLDWIHEYFSLFLPLLKVHRTPFRLLREIGKWASRRGYEFECIVGNVEIDSKSVSKISTDEDCFNECSVFAPQIKQVTLLYWGTDMPIIFKMLRACKQVEELHCRRVPLYAYYLISDICSKLTTIDLSGGYEKISEASFSSVLRVNRRLTSIDVSACFIGRVFLNTLIVECRGLKALNIRRCSLPLRERFMLSMHGRLNLESLSCTGFETLDMKCLLQWQNFAALKYLDLSESHWMSGANLYLLRTHCNNLTYINLGDCARVDEGALFAVAELKQLQTCLLMLIPNISATSVMKIATLCSVLHTLSLYKVEMPFDCAEMVTLAKVCASLTDLSLVDMRTGSDETMAGILLNGERLKILNISVNRQLTDRTLQDSAHCLKNIRKLNISQCRQFTRESLNSIATHCKKLVELNCVDCPLMSLALVNALRTSNVMIIHNLNK